MPDPISGDLLTDPLIACRLMDGKAVSLTLPGTLALLADPTRQVESFPALQAHQAHAWHAFTVQVAAMVCQRAGVGIEAAECRCEDWWRERLLALAGDASAWVLVVEDLGRPAFMQPAVPAKSISDWPVDACFYAPDHLPYPSNTKNHDVKTGKASFASMDCWVFSLIALQTMQTYKLKYRGIARVGGGTGVRVGVGVITDQDLGLRFRRDSETLIRNASRIQGERQFSLDGLGLTWADREGWDGTTSLTRDQLHPYFIESCYRLRLVQAPDGQLSARLAPSERPHVSFDPDTGDVGDPWLPIQVESRKALSIRAGGFTTKWLAGFFSRDVEKAMCQSTLPEVGPAWMHFEGLARDGKEFKTLGFFVRTIEIPMKHRPKFKTVEGQHRIGDRGFKYLESIADIRRQALWPAIIQLHSNQDTVNNRNKASTIAVKKAESVTSALEIIADQRFFPHLWEHLDEDRDAACLSWQTFLRDQAHALLETALATAAPGAALRWKRIAAATSLFWHGLYKAFPDLRPDRPDPAPLADPAY